MREYVSQNSTEAEEVTVGRPAEKQTGKMTVLEALAEETNAISPNRSNASTRIANSDADPDDQ